MKAVIPIETVEHAAGQLLRLAPDVQVLEPRALRDALIRKLREIERCYGLAGSAPRRKAAKT